MVVGCKVKPLSCQGCHQLSTVSIPVHFDHFEALNHHFIDEPTEAVKSDPHEDNFEIKLGKPSVFPDLEQQKVLHAFVAGVWNVSWRVVPRRAPHNAMHRPARRRRRKPRRPPHPSTIPGLSQHATLSTMSNAKAGSPTINTEESVVNMPQVRKPRAVSGGNNLFYSFPPPFATPATD